MGPKRESKGEFSLAFSPWQSWLNDHGPGLYREISVKAYRDDATGDG